MGNRVLRQTGQWEEWYGAAGGGTKMDRIFISITHCCTPYDVPGMRWTFFGSPDMPEYEAMKSPMDSRGVALLKGFLDLSRPWVSVGKICRKGSVAGWTTSTGPNGKVLVIPNDRLESLSRDLVWVPG